MNSKLPFSSLFDDPSFIGLPLFKELGHPGIVVDCTTEF